MNNLNITNIHDNSKSQVWVGLDTKKFQIKNTGKAIAIEDKANSVTTLKVGGSSGFSITYSGGKIIFSANSGGSPLTVVEPSRGGITGCPFYYCHQDKYSGGASAASVMSLRSNALNSDDTSTVVSRSSNTSDDIVNIVDETKLLDPSNLEDGTIMMVVNGHWIEYSFDDLYEEITSRMTKKYNLQSL